MKYSKWIGLILLVIFSGATAFYTHGQYTQAFEKRQTQIKQAQIAEVMERAEAVKNEGQIKLLEKELALQERELNQLQQQEVEEGERWVAFPTDLVVKGDQIIYRSYNDEIYRYHPELDNLELIYKEERPWYVVGCDVARDGRVVVAQEKSTGSIENGNFQNQIQLLLIEPASTLDTFSDSTFKQPKVLREIQSTSSDGVYDIQSVHFSPEGDYLIVKYLERGRAHFSLYSLATLKELVDLTKVPLYNHWDAFTYLTVLEDQQQVLLEATGDTNQIYKYDLVEQTVDRSAPYNFYVQDYFTDEAGDLYLLGNRYDQPDLQMYNLSKDYKVE